MPSKFDSHSHDPVYGCSKPQNITKLPSTQERVIGGRRFSKAPELHSETFSSAHRHYGMMITTVSAATLSIDESPLRLEVEGALLCACGENAVWNREEVPLPSPGKSFYLLREIDLFPGGEIQKLSPGLYETGDSFVDKKTHRVYLELTRETSTSSQSFCAVVGICNPQEYPQCVDWRALEPARVIKTVHKES